MFGGVGLYNKINKGMWLPGAKKSAAKEGE
jgi:hypothetical protein